MTLCNYEIVTHRKFYKIFCFVFFMGLIEFRNGVSKDDWVVRDNLKIFSKIPYFDLIEKEGGKVVFFNGCLTDNHELSCLKGAVPRGWGESSWDKAAGAYDPKNKLIFIGVEGQYESMKDCGVHETGHFLDRAVGKLIFGKSLCKTEEIKYLMEKESTKSYYFHIPAEFVADGFDKFYKTPETRNFLKRKFPLRYKYFKDLEELHLSNFKK